MKTHFDRRVFGDSITPDHIEIKNPINFGRNDEHFSLTILDPATKWMVSYPLKEKTAYSIVDCVTRFLGPGWNTRVQWRT